MSQPLPRREFLTRSLAFGAMAATTPGFLHAQAPSNEIRIGVMGMGRGRSVAQSFAKIPGVVVAYVCDTDSERLAAGHKEIEKNTGQTATPVSDFRKMLDDKSVDILVVAAPNHWHAPAAILGCSAGKHVYVEKPCSHNPHEGEVLVEASRKHKRAVQMGNQRRSAPGFIEAIAKIKDGAIGRPYHSRSWYSNLRPTTVLGAETTPPKTLDYELWQGPAPRAPYVEGRIHYNWHWFWDWGNGELGNNGVHSIDISRWALGVDLPTKVLSAGGRYRFKDDQQTPDTQTVTYEFGDAGSITWEGLSCNKHAKGFVHVYGEAGSMEIDESGTYRIYDKNDKVIEEKTHKRNDTEHALNLVEAIRNDKPLALNSEILEGHRTTMLCHLGNIAHRTGRTLHCDPATGRIQDDPEAMKYWTRSYEKGWEPKA
ncbi:Gfo/Idh/MocA family protein [Planctomyces sp. SH-PL14]|uniref:Gfo/Idh/MocA family protein n=1 Tax=Planctomyces sp. SH-PL14 TaxID=1632864 RepID=UPI00078B2AB0|nr:Gfo/Idh/MocA family oxidoreductase [Planctomyces sp. SH-PL14]AMV20895.1 Inositol 2-dehydrogenase [Planctomyces sp. SH-PL14]